MYLYLNSEVYVLSTYACQTYGLQLRGRFCSVLGPVLFNDMPLQLQTDTDIYADDTMVEVVEPKLQNSADDFNTWCIDNNMGGHYGKTHAFVKGSKHMTSFNEGISVTRNENTWA